MKKTIDFWYEFASPYSYLAAMRVEDVAGAAGVDVVWRPFLLGAIYKRMEMPMLPMQLSPQKAAYMWMDVARQAKRYGLDFNKPVQFPQIGILAARVALVGKQEGWCPAFSRGVYHANFVHGADISKKDVIGPILAEIGHDAEDIFERAATQAIKDELRAETDKAFDKGIFGVPTFFAGDQMFWGNDRLEQALEAVLN